MARRYLHWPSVTGCRASAQLAFYRLGWAIKTGWSAEGVWLIIWAVFGRSRRGYSLGSTRERCMQPSIASTWITRAALTGCAPLAHTPHCTHAPNTRTMHAVLIFPAAYGHTPQHITPTPIQPPKPQTPNPCTPKPIHPHTQLTHTVTPHHDAP